MTSWAKIGAKCEYVGLDRKTNPVPGSRFYPGMVKPKEGVEYKVTNVFWCTTYNVLRVCVTGAPNPNVFGQDAGWNVNAFRPLIKDESVDVMKRDIDMFIRIVNSSPISEGAK